MNTNYSINIPNPKVLKAACPFINIDNTTLPTGLIQNPNFSQLFFSFDAPFNFMGDMSPPHRVELYW